MSNTIISQYNRNIRPVMDEQAITDLFTVITKMTPQQQQRFWVRSETVGNVFLYRDEAKHPGKVLEYVQGSQDDSVSTLYESSDTFSLLSGLVKVRTDLINEIGAVLGRLPSTIGVEDLGREREVSLKELGTAQLIDTLALFTATDLKAA